MSDEVFFEFIDNALCLFDCFNFKIGKFCIIYISDFKVDPQFDSRISFATRKNVEELTLKNRCRSRMYMLPEHLFNYAYLVKLKASNCMFMPSGSIKWKHLKELKLIACELHKQVIECVLSGSPLLESVELLGCFRFRQLVVTSKSLKRLVLTNSKKRDIAFACPNLEKLKLKSLREGKYFTISNQVIENVLSTCRLLKSLELYRCNGFDQLVITTKLLRRLVLKELNVPIIEISIPKLKELKLKNLDGIKTFKLMDVPSSITAAIDWGKALVDLKKFVGSMMSVKELRIRRYL